MLTVPEQERIIELFQSLGFVGVGFWTPPPGGLGPWYQPWLEQGFQGEMGYMEKNQEIRQEPLSIHPGAKSIITLAFPYHTQAPPGWEEDNPISNYAWGLDYHQVLKKKAQEAMAQLQAWHPQFEGRAFTDSAPLPEKILAQASGLGWIGKNSLLIHPKWGSYLFLVEILCNLELTPTAPHPDRCGTCDLCLQACPTQAIHPGKLVDARACLSYLTIEIKRDFSPQEAGMVDHQIFGCDLCQKVCPWNQKAPLQKGSPFAPLERWQGLSPQGMLAWTEEDWERLKINSPLKRPGLKGLQRNARAVLKKMGKKLHSRFDEN